ncbi:MFS transporter [Cohnella endophytica]|uniref:MFS transporter n=1 Tax=Cohnella endophytica TaxID=2419778 RepID=A0A494Y684_9BACL|nr:MFS transporter [Cohnella endophytica]RKP58180.1 MFS transporter [Cohnella endophytica]
MDFVKRLRENIQLPFLRNALMLFFMEWVRGAFLISLLPSFAADRWGLSLALIGTAVSVHYLTDNLVKSFVGFMLDRYPARFVLHSGFALALIGIGMTLFIHVPWVLLVSSGLLGIGFSPIWLVSLSQVKEEKRAEQMGLLYVFWLAGLGLGPLTINLFLDYGYRAAFTLLISMFVAGWLLVGRGHGRISSLSMTSVPIRKQLVQLWDRLKKSRVLVPGMVLQTMAAGMLIPFLSTFAVDRVGLSHAQFSLVILTGGGFAVASLVPLGKWFDRYNSKWFLVCGFGLFSVALFALLFVRSFFSIEGAAILMGVSYAGLLPAWNALMARYIPPESQGAGWGIFSTVEGMGIVVGPLIGSWLAASGNIALPFAVSAVLFGLISLYYCFLRSNPLCLIEES